MAFRRSALAAAGGFDERFPRAYREDADLALRLLRSGWRLVRGRRRVTHPVGPADRWVSLRLQRGNADDRLMTVLHGRAWRAPAGAPPGRLRRHAAVTATGLAALALATAGRRTVAAPAGALWLAGTAELAWARIAPGPRTREEVATMATTSVALPPVAVAHALAGLVGARTSRRPPSAPPPDAVLLDRDGTLVVDVPYNGEPGLVRAVPGAREALDRLREAGVKLAMISNQSGIGRGLLTAAQVEAVNARVEELLGPLGPQLVCPHAPESGCACRKPAPGLVLAAASRLGVAPERCVVIGDIGSDVEAARAAGARGVLVPTPVTRREEVVAAPNVAPNLASALDLIGVRP
jgi:HAD superfamily hydrolase (TIGR01662 family)